MTLRSSLGLTFATLLAATGCVHSPRMSAVHIAEPGTDIVSGEGSISISHTTGNSSRVCTRLVPEGKKGKGKGMGGGQPAGPAGAIDVLLFRLCEARGNGDIGAEQYATSVQTIMKMMEASSMHPPMPMRTQPGPNRGPRDFGDEGPHGDGEGRGMRRGPWRGPGLDGPGGPPPGKPEPPKKDPPK